MSEHASNGEDEKKLVVFAPRIDPSLREQIEGIRQITGQTINDLGQEALRDWVDKKLDDEEVRNKAMAGIQDEERRLQERRAAIEKVLGTAAAAPSSETPADTGSGSGRGGRRGKGADG